MLPRLLASPVAAPAVAAELEAGVDHGHAYLDDALELLGAEIPILDVDEASAVERRLDAGERQSLAIAIAEEGTLATDDLAGREAAASMSVPVTGSIGLLVYGIRQGTIDREVASEWLNTWEDVRGYYAPIDDIEAVLDRTEE